MTSLKDAQQWCAECGNAMHADEFGARPKCCNGWGYWAALKPEPRDSWWPAIQQRGFYLYRNEAKWPKGMNPVLPIAGGTDRQTEELMQIGPEAQAGNVPVASAADGKAAAPYAESGRDDDEPAEVTIRRIRNEWEGEHTNPEQLTTSPERVQIPAESEHVAPFDRCPKCTAHMPVGKTCGSDECGLRGK